MILELRQSLKSYASRAFLWIFLSMMVLGGGLSFNYKNNSDFAIKVYDELATFADWRQAITNQQRQMDYLKQLGINWPRTESVETEVLRQLMSNLLMHNVAKDLHLMVPENIKQDQLANMLQSLPEHFFLPNGKLNIDMLEKVIAPKSFDSLLVDIENEAKVNLLYSLASLGFYVCRFESQAEYVQEYADKKYSVLTLSLENVLQEIKKQAVSDDVLEKFYKKSEHGDAYKTVEKRAGVCWKFNAKEYGVFITDAEALAYYESHKKTDYIEHPAQVQVHRIIFNSSENAELVKSEANELRELLLQDPTQFVAQAKALQKNGKHQYEKTEFFAKDSKEYDTILVTTAFEQLEEDLSISPVIKTDKGYELLQRMSRKPAKYKPLTQVKAAIEEKLVQEKFEKRFKQDAQRLVGHAGYNDTALSAFIEKKHAHQEVINLQAAKPGIITSNLFKTEHNDYAVFMDGTQGVLLQCTQLEKRTLKSFESIKTTVLADFHKKQAIKELESITKQAMNQATDKDLDAIAVSLHGTVERATFTYSKEKAEWAPVLSRPEVMQKVKTLTSVGQITHVTTSTESFIIRLDDVAKIDEKLYAEKESLIKKSLVGKAKYKARDSFIASLYRHAKLNNKIEIKDQLIKDIKESSL